MPASHRQDPTAFIPRLAAVGFCGNAFASCALETMRQALETPRLLVGTDGNSELSVGDLLPAMNAWLLVAWDKMDDLRK